MSLFPDRPLNIWFDDRIFTIQRYGGISRYFTELASGLDAAGQRVHVDAPLHINGYLGGLPCHAGLRLPSFRGASRLCQQYNGLFEAARQRGFVPDIVHETYFRSGAPDAGRARRVITMYDMIHERFDNRAADDALSRARRRAVERSDHVICISHSTRRDLVELFGVDEARTSVIHLAASLHPVAGAARPLDAPYILYVGPRGRYKNFASLLRAYAMSPGVMADFLLLCVGGGEFTSDEMDLIRELGIDTGRVVRMDADDHTLSACYQHATVFVYPSLYEGFGIPPLEAMQCGCPVICSSSSSLPEVVGDAAMLFDQENPEALASALVRMLSGGTAEEYAAAGRLHAAGFTWAQCVSDTLSLYHSLSLRES